MRTFGSQYFAHILLGVFLAIASAANAQQPGQEEIEIVDLGDRVQGETYPIKLTAENLNCNAPQDFRFDLRATPWLVAEGEPVARQVPAGESKSINARLDFTNVPPGEYQGDVLTICETCGFIPLFKNCRASDKSIRLRVRVVPAQQEPDDVHAQNQADAADAADPAAADGNAPAETAQVEQAKFTAPLIPNVDDSVREDLRRSQQRAIDRARDKMAKANAAAAAAVDALNAQRKKCKDCWDEVARLEAEARDKQAAANQAKAEADAAEQAAKDAEQHLKDYQKELKAASDKMDSAYRTVQMQAAARTAIGRDFGQGSEQYQHADEQVEKAIDANEAAQRAFSAIRASKEAREKAAKDARDDANAKKKVAEGKQEEADDAKKAAEKKRKECEKLDDACQKAEDDAKDAKAAAAEAAQAAQDKVDEANALAAANIREDLKVKRKAHDDCIEKLKQIARRNLKLFKILRDIGQLKKEEGPRPDIDVEETVATWVATSIADNVASYVPVPTFEVFTILDGLQAMYQILQLKQTLLTPGTAGYRGDDYLKDFLLEKGHADNPAEARELVKQVNKFMSNRRSNPDYLKEEWEYEVARCKKLAEEIKTLEGKLAAATK